MNFTSAQISKFQPSFVISESTRRMEELIDSDFEQIEVPCLPVSYAEYSHCYSNVEKKILRDGGTIEYGWFISHNAFYAEATHHAVWQNNMGELFDISPLKSPYPCSSIAFIPDDRIIYSGLPIDSVRLNLTDNPVVDDYLLVAEATEHIKACGIRTNRNKITLSDDSALLLEKILTLGQQLIAFFVIGKNEKNECYCGSGRPYSECHSIEIKRKVVYILANTPGKLIKLSV